VFKKKNMIECQTVELMKRNQKINISHQEVVLMSTCSMIISLSQLTGAGDEAVQTLIEEVRGHMSALFKICEAIAMLDMVSSPSYVFNAWLT
jgi:DNA mismatch repair protein MSH4